MSAAYEMFSERQEAEDEAAWKPIGVKVELLKPKPRVKCENCSRPVDGTFYCERCAETRRRRRAMLRRTANGLEDT